MAVATKERKKRASFDELLLAGVRAVAERGIDHVSVSDVAKLSEVSRPTFYTYFGDMPGFFAEIWLRFGREWLDAQVCETIEIDPNLNQAMLEIVSVGRRVPQVFEVLQPDFTQWWQERTKGNDIAAQRLVWELGFLLGYQLSSKVSSKAHLGLEIRDFLKLPDDVLNLPIMAGLGTRILPEVIPPMGGLSQISDSVEDSLTQAAIEVISSSGVASASMTRIARRARVSTGSVYPRFKSSEALIHQSFTTAIQTIVSGNVQMVSDRGLNIDMYGATINAGFGEDRKVWRNFRTEVHVEAVHNVELANFIESGFELSTQFLLDSFVEFGVKPDVAEKIAWFLHSHAIGISIIHSMLPEIATYDNRIMARWLMQGLLNGRTVG